MGEYRFPKTVRDALRSWGFWEDGQEAQWAAAASQFALWQASAIPQILVEVLSPTDRWSEIAWNASFFLSTGVIVFCVLDPKAESVTVYRGDEPPQSLKREEELTFPDLLPEFRIKVSEFFD